MRVLWAMTAMFGGTAMAQGAGPPFPRIANCYGVRLVPDSTPDDIEEIARFDLLIGGVWANWKDEEHRQKLAQKIAVVRQKNPQITILDFSSSAPYAHPNDETFPETGWLLQPDGRHIAGWPGTEMINLTKPEVIDWLVARSVASVQERGFDGTFIDCMGGGFDWWACNIEGGESYQVDANEDGRADERERLNRAWIDAKTQLSRKVRDAIGADVPFMTNQAGDWGFPYMNGILLEDYLDYVLDGRMSWDHVLKTYLQWTEAPHRPNVTTIVSSSGIQPPFDPWQSMNEEAREALLERGRNLLGRMRFGLTTTLMGDGYFAYDLHTRWRGQRWWYPEYDAPLGYPEGPAEKQADGTWRREFDGGTVIVNPTRFDARVEFGGRRLDVSSGKVDVTFIIPPQDGRILLPSDAEIAAGTIPDPDPLFTIAGPEPIVERDGRVLARLDGLAAIFDEEGRLLVLTDGTRTLLEQLRPFIVSDDRWRDFGYEECSHRVLGERRLEFAGHRTEGDVALAYRQTVALKGKEATIGYLWEALTDAHIHMWRHQVDFPVSQYGGGGFAIGGAQGELPADRAPQPNLAQDFTDITLSSTEGRAVSVSVSGSAGLVDERHYGVQAYRLGHYPVHGDVEAGAEWEVSLTVRVE